MKKTLIPFKSDCALLQETHKKGVNTLNKGKLHQLNTSEIKLNRRKKSVAKYHKPINNGTKKTTTDDIIKKNDIEEPNITTKAVQKQP